MRLIKIDETTIILIHTNWKKLSMNGYGGKINWWWKKGHKST